MSRSCKSLSKRIWLPAMAAVCLILGASSADAAESLELNIAGFAVSETSSVIEISWTGATSFNSVVADGTTQVEPDILELEGELFLSGPVVTGGEIRLVIDDGAGGTDTLMLDSLTGFAALSDIVSAETSSGNFSDNAFGVAGSDVDVSNFVDGSGDFFAGVTGSILLNTGTGGNELTIVIPEPAAGILLGVGGIMLLRRRRRVE